MKHFIDRNSKSQEKLLKSIIMKHKAKENLHRKDGIEAVIFCSFLFASRPTTTTREDYFICNNSGQESFNKGFLKESIRKYSFVLFIWEFLLMSGSNKNTRICHLSRFKCGREHCYLIQNLYLKKKNKRNFLALYQF